MDASCKVQGSIHVLSRVHKSMCPGFWVHIKAIAACAGFFIEGRMRPVGPAVGKVRARLPAKPKNSVSEREPQAGGTQDSFLKKS